jgi:hypothetical protein
MTARILQGLRARRDHPFNGKSFRTGSIPDMDVRRRQTFATIATRYAGSRAAPRPSRPRANVQPAAGPLPGRHDCACLSTPQI